MVDGLPCLNLFARWQKVLYSLSMLASLAHGYMACPAQLMESHLHARRNPSCRNDPARVNDPRAADPAGRSDLGQTVDGDFAELGGFQPVRFFAVCSGSPSNNPIFP